MIYRLMIGALTVLGVCCAQAADEPRAAPQHPPSDALPMATLLDVAQTAIATCKERGWPVAVTVVDNDQSIRLVLRADGAGAGVVNISRRKALTVIKTGMASADFAKTLSPEDMPKPKSAGGPGMDGPVKGDPDLVAAAGGVPIVVNGKTVGAIGISGSPSPGDVVCASAGLAKIPSAGK